LRVNDYVKDWSEFEFMPGILKALASWSAQFKYIIIVTNQRGIGRGLMTEEDLTDIHRRMVAEISKNGGRIDRIYYCADVDVDNPDRKPNIGMALKAKADFPDIDFSKSVMVGDSDSDMEFGIKSGMRIKKIDLKAKIKLAVIISSCDAYSDCWSPLIHSLQLHWPDCPFPVYVVSNAKEIQGAIFLKVGPDCGWGPNLTKALGMIDYEYILYLQEDYFPDHRVDTAMMMQHLEYCQGQEIDYLRLSWPFQDKHRMEGVYCDDKLNFRYALCLQAAIWRKSVLQQLSAGVKSGWEFERNITRIIAKKQIPVEARVIHSSAFPAAGFSVVDGTAIRKGLWTVAGARFLAENGFAGLLPLRKVEGPLTTRLMQVKNPVLRVPAAILLRGMKYINVLTL
jgi:histidinol-phosphate phosphatase family protein